MELITRQHRQTTERKRSMHADTNTIVQVFLSSSAIGLDINCQLAIHRSFNEAETHVQDGHACAG